MKSKSSKSQSSKPRKRQRRKYDDEDDDDDDDEDNDSIEDDSIEEAEEDEEEEEVEMGPSGRPRRGAAPKEFQNLSEEEEDEIKDDEDDGQEDDDEEQFQSPKRQKRKIITLHGTPGKFPTSGGRRRSARQGSASATSSRPGSSHMPPSRRSSRIAHDDSEEAVALSSSGHHAEPIQQGSSSPPAGKRPQRGGKGIKKPTTSTVYEQSQESAAARAQSTDELQKQLEVAASREGMEVDAEEREGAAVEAEGVSEREADESMREVAIIPESDPDDSDPIGHGRRGLRRRETKPTSADENLASERSTRKSLRSTLGKRKARSSQRGNQESSDFEPMGDEGGEEDISDSEASASSPRKGTQGDESSPGGRGAKRRKITRSRRVSDNDSDVEADELAEELVDLKGSDRRRQAAKARKDIIMDQPRQRRAAQKQVDYRIINPELQFPPDEDDGAPAQSTPSKRARGGGTGYRSLFSTYGPFGGAGGPPPVLGGPEGLGATAGADSDSSDDENLARPKAPGVGGLIGMTPTTSHAPNLGLFPATAAQVHGADPAQTPANLGKVKDKQALADADPLGVDQNINFDAVGGLQGHIDQLKEMVALPLLYPEVFQRFHVTPPRGVLFHGPPGTGKTLLARALASSVSSQGKKVTFYMRKGADALSKWVGEAEKQLRLLFEEARKNQPSIIFFDEIDGLAPVRSSKQEQIHASIVSTLLALMDGMDGRGQVIVIGATNRPDSIDPALRRPGRFDREFYFPLPNVEARRTILDIHTKGWNPPLPLAFKDDIASATKGYGGADLRALCTEAALNAVQRRYPQIYKSNEKLQIRPETINVTAKDFMISIKKMIPSSERSASSGAAPLPKQIEPLLRQPLKEIENAVANILPQKKRLTALEEAEFEDAEDDRGMMVERMQQEFERSRVFRPRLLIRGIHGMGQQYLAGALLNHFEGLHVQSFDLPTLLSDSTRSSEAAIVQLFTEVKRHKPSVIYIPNVDVWYRTVGNAVISTFLGLLRTLAPTDPILLLGVLECHDDDVEPNMIRDLFGFSRKNQYRVERPNTDARKEYFNAVVEYLNNSPADFPEPANRKKRVFEALPAVPPEPEKGPTPLSKAEEKAQKKKDRLLLNQLKVRIQPVMDHIKMKYKKFRAGVIDDSQISYLYEEDDPAIVTTDLPLEQMQMVMNRPFEKAADDHGETGLRETATGKFYYNIEIVTIEKRLSNGYYKRPKDFLADIKKLAKDAKAIDDQDRLIKANELLSNVEVDMATIETNEPWLANELENVYAREQKRQQEMVEKAKKAAAEEGRMIEDVQSNVPPKEAATTSISDHTGPIILGQPMPNGVHRHPLTPSNPSYPSQPASIMTNGISDLSDLNPRHQSNGTSVRADAETHGTNSDEYPSLLKETDGSSFGPSAQTRPMESHTGAPTTLEQRRSIPGSLSQVSAITPIAEGASIRDYTNYASTTSSDKRNTGSSGDKNPTQSTDGNKNATQGTDERERPAGPSFAHLPEPSDPGSQVLPGMGPTQGKQSYLAVYANRVDKFSRFPIQCASRQWS